MRALLSVSDKTGIVELGRGLAARGFELISTGGTAKTLSAVLAVVDPADYERLLRELDTTPSLAFRYELMRKALAHTGAYDTAISATLATIDLAGDRFERRVASTPSGLDARIDVA